MGSTVFNREERQSCTVLFVGHKDYLLTSIDRIFTGSHIRFLKAINAREALDIIHREEIAVVVSENHLSGMKGIDLITKVNTISPATLKILITTDADMMTAVNAINKGIVSRVIIKPWEGEDLFENVSEVVIQYHVSRALKSENKATLLSIAQAVELKDVYTLGHCERVTMYALLLAHAYGISPAKKKDIRYGSSLHDFGKINIPDSILNKKGPLSDDEYSTIKNHPGWGANVARHIKLSRQIVNIILYHHERYDRKGYPHGIRGTDIPLETRIVTTADIYDALTSYRPYRGKYSEEEAIDILKSMKGTVLDPELLDLFLNTCLKFKGEQVSHALEESAFYPDAPIQSMMENVSDYRKVKILLK